MFPIGNPGLDGQNNTPATLACLNLGVEVPTTAAFVICVSVAGPALIGLGLPPLSKHLFVFWFTLLSTITLPVCGAVFIGDGMVQLPWGESP
ncbi:MAG: TRAP transporter large permease subunit [Pseudomonadota bacterium]|nr:TRAP transporter large permease subunit [Pseudomonadota bacterium]MEC8061743.1 TRAP transporter large permease subunit [Pseudomonadota bacterium]MEC8083127.1 TRAP transporter large permease subunit [Pseudomonadota bacterium]MEC8282113.1 TRAP transporter large permease subunit [Pseudomonadota bacterium]MEC8318632.1 TRAP transporter large permease subunit [Pseudomonadota bacterium]